MIETDKRKAVFLLHQEGMSVREITRRLGLSRNTVRAIIAGKGVMAVRPRKDKQQIDPQLLRSLHEQCRGRIQRMHEKLVEEGRYWGKLFHFNCDAARIRHHPSSENPMQPGAR